MEKNFRNESLVDVAYDILKEDGGSLSFNKLWAKVCELEKITKEESDAIISTFYTNLSMDGRIVILKDGSWSLRDNTTFDKSHVDLSEFYDEMADSEDSYDDEDEDEDSDKSDEDEDDDDEDGNNEDNDSSEQIGDNIY